MFLIYLVWIVLVLFALCVTHIAWVGGCTQLLEMFGIPEKYLLGLSIVIVEGIPLGISIYMECLPVGQTIGGIPTYLGLNILMFVLGVITHLVKS